ncbi:ATP-binding cassette domain-containing protein [Acidobacteria bacterium AH-259-D05]|nr:ATP-binding cassette domain-containing protein [Acidobacteria bacterium AH-259-D05]
MSESHSSRQAKEKSTAQPRYAVEARQVVKRYGALTAVDQVEFTVDPGEAFGLLGPNGAGKSTIMRMIYGRTLLTSGHLLVEGWDVKHHPQKIKALVGVVPQENNLDPDLNVIDNLSVYARYFRIPRGKIQKRAEELLDFVNLMEKRNTWVETLSGGMKRRLIVARALINNPRVLVLDEPTTGLDPHVRHDLWDRLRELRSRNITILLSTHYMEEAEKLCDRLIIIDQAKILAMGKPAELIERNVSKFVLEIHEADGLKPLTPRGEVITEVHGATHYYFAPTPELLTPLMGQFASHKSLLRPSNLEDVFLKLTGSQTQ